MARFIQQQIEKSPSAQRRMEQLPPEQREKGIAMQATGTKTVFYIYPVFTLIGGLIIAAVLMAVFNFLLGAEVPFQRAMAVVSAIHAEHEAHLAQLRSRLVLPARLATSRPRQSPTPAPLPAGWRSVLAALAAAETAASDRLIGWVAAAPPALAQLMASIAASEAAHVVLLGHQKAGR